MPDLSLDDIGLHYEVDGSGPPIILLAGMFSDSASWAALLPFLTSQFTVIRPDNRTTGRTTPWDAAVSIGQMARDAKALMDHLDIGHYHIVGHSMGGLTAMELAGLAPDAVASLTIMASAPIRAPRTIAVFDALCRIRHMQEGEELWLRALYPWIFRPAFFQEPQNTEIAIEAARAYPHAQHAAAMAHQIEALRSFRPATRPADLTCPTQVIYGADDVLIPEHPAREAFAAIADVTQITLPDAGHSVHWDAPDAVARTVTQFIAQHPIGART